MEKLLFTVLFLLPITVFAQSVDFSATDKQIIFTENGDTVLLYVLEKLDFDAAFTRPHYIHPLFAPSGEVITEDFPEDHPHHHGIFWAWHQLFVGDMRIGDGWLNQDVNWTVDSVNILRKEEGALSLESFVSWDSPLLVDEQGKRKTIIKERFKITVQALEDGIRVVDFKIILVPQLEEVKLGGSEDVKGYGGFSARVKLDETTSFHGENGIIKPKNGPVEAGPWIKIENIPLEKENAGICIISHPSNIGYPNPWILRQKGSMQNAVFPFPGAKAIELEKNVELVLKYRILVYNGSLASERVNVFSKKFEGMW